jgi:molybdopterin-guanine dinucleotide biosynthesis protein A
VRDANAHVLPPARQTGHVRVAVVVLAGGAARRWDGRDKTAALLGSGTVLEHAVRGLRAGVRDGAPRGSRGSEPDDGELSLQVVVAGPSDQAGRPGLAGVRWVREDPPGGGPVPGLAAALGALTPDVEVVVVGAGDAPFGGSAVPRLLAALDEALDGVVGVDPSCRRQPLLAAYRLAPLRAAVEALDGASGVPLRAVVDRLRVAGVPVTRREALDLDTPATLEVAARELERNTTDVPGAGLPS